MPKLLAIDLDGTLFYPKGTRRKLVSKKNKKFLQDFIDAGNRVVLVTSRGIVVPKQVVDEVERDIDLITANGSYIIANKEVIKDEPINKESLQQVMDYLDKNHKPMAYLMTTDKNPCIIKNNRGAGKFLLTFYRLFYWFQGCYREPMILDNKMFEEAFNNERIYKVMTFYGLRRNKAKLTKELNKLIREEHSYLESSWSSIVNELTPKGCSKSEGLAFYCEKLNINHDDVYVIGDSGNDISMFNEYHEHSFVMKHAYPSVKKYAKHSVSRVFKLRDYVLKGVEKK